VIHPAPLLLGFLPVVLFLAALRTMDSYRLVGRAAVLRSIAIGAVAALCCLAPNDLAMTYLPLTPAAAKRYIIPVVEECAKALYLVYLVKSERLGFLVDAGIHGFAIGTGFALAENALYAISLGDAGVPVWLIRGLGTAVMHGSTTAIVGILAKHLHDRWPSRSLARAFAPGLAIAIAVHSFFNHLVLHPMIMTALLLGVMPLLLLVVFEISERATRGWLSSGFDSEFERLETILDDRTGGTRMGAYLKSLGERLSGPVVADMLCLIRLHLELSLRAKGVLIARATGVEMPLDPSIEEKFREMAYLEHSIGRTGKLAILPFIRTGSRDVWQLQVLHGRERPRARRDADG
jgi:RsiW-degrading membrane proteinase PrsW (M82 family)